MNHFPFAVRSRVAAGVLAAVTLTMGLSACAPLIVGGAVGGALVAVDRRTSGAQLDDQGIELRSNNRLKDELGDARARVAVTSYNRRVLLTGEAASEAVKTQITQIVSGVSNVREVINELGVTNSPTLKERATDTRGRQRPRCHRLQGGHGARHGVLDGPGDSARSRPRHRHCTQHSGCVARGARARDHHRAGTRQHAAPPRCQRSEVIQKQRLWRCFYFSRLIRLDVSRRLPPMACTSA